VVRQVRLAEDVGIRIVIIVVVQQSILSISILLGVR
jgi:hypothetical protein